MNMLRDRNTEWQEQNIDPRGENNEENKLNSEPEIGNWKKVNNEENWTSTETAALQKRNTSTGKQALLSAAKCI